MGLVLKFRTKRNLMWFLLFVLINNSLWIDYTYGTTFHGNEYWYTFIDNVCQIILCFGGITLFYRFFLLLELVAKKLTHLIRFK